MSWRFLVLIGLIAVVPPAALAGDFPDDVAGQAILGSVASTAGLELTQRRGPGSDVAKLDYVAALGVEKASAYHRLEVVPEPTTGLLMLLGLLSLARRRR